jgi:hypothetical protein
VQTTKAEAAKSRAEAEGIRLNMLVRKLELLIQAETAISREQIMDFLTMLRRLGR